MAEVAESGRRNIYVSTAKTCPGPFRGECDSESPEARVFGGHVLAQGLSAAYFTVAEGFYVHSVHCYFIRGGKETNGAGETLPIQETKGRRSLLK